MTERPKERLDKWLWFARFFKSRSLSAKAVTGGKVRVNGVHAAKASAAIGDCQWDTAIWFDKKMNTYLLPIKSEVRKKTGIQLDDPTAVTIWV